MFITLTIIIFALFTITGRDSELEENLSWGHMAAYLLLSMLLAWGGVFVIKLVFGLIGMAFNYY